MARHLKIVQTLNLKYLLMNFEYSADFAKKLDEEDPLKEFRNEFFIPVLHGQPSIYFTGNSLGLQPKKAQDNVLDALEDWATYGVEGHEHARNPWLGYQEMFPALLAPILGAKPEEIVVMNQLTVNLHLLLTTFYRPDKKRYKILIEEKAFPSDEYAIESHIKLAGLSNDALLEVCSRENETLIREEDVLAAIEECGDDLALVLFGGVNYYSGQVFNMKKITEAAHKVGAKCGFDLAHAAGNVPLQLHDWDVDFACWCSYKYLNSGPGGVGGAFIHERYIKDATLLRLQGWWGTNKERRFKMEKDFDPIPTAEGWQLSNAPIISMAVHKAALDIFQKAGFQNILDKSKLVSAWLHFVLQEVNNSGEKIFDLITPSSPEEHGSQVSLLMLKDGKHFFEILKNNRVIADWREPDVIRIAPVPLYNTFSEVFTFGEILRKNISIAK